MFGVIASSTRLGTPNKGHQRSNPHSYKSEAEHNCEVSKAKNIPNKERETFLEYGLFNMVAGRRTAELLHKQHKHGHHRNSQPEVSHNSLAELFHFKHTHAHAHNSSKLKKYSHSQTVDLSNKCLSHDNHRKLNDCERACYEGKLIPASSTSDDNSHDCSNTKHVHP